MKKKIKKKIKKKGFTLIELMAVIAIISILTSIVTLKVDGYKNKAHKSNIQTAAKSMVYAIQAYNSDAASRTSATGLTPGLTALNTDYVNNVISVINTVNGGVSSTIDESNASYLSLNALTIAELCGVANGDFNYQIGVYVSGSSAITKLGSLD